MATFRQVISGDESTRIHAAAGGAALEAKDVGGIDGRCGRDGTQKRNVPKGRQSGTDTASNDDAHADANEMNLKQSTIQSTASENIQD